MPKGKEVVIVGGGIAGCSVAYHLTKRGIKPLIIEKDSVGARASGKAWGTCPHPDSILLKNHAKGTFLSMPVETTGGVEPFLELYRIGWYRMADIAQDIKETGGIDIEYFRHPWISLADSEESEQLAKFNLDFLEKRGSFGFKWLDEKDLKALFANINPKFRGGVSVPFYQVETYKYTLGYAQAAEKRGAEIKQGNVVGFGTHGSRITSVKLAQGTEIEADIVVMGMGPWLRDGVSFLGKELDIVVNREQCLLLDLPQKLPLSVLTTEPVSIASKLNGQVIIGKSVTNDIVSELEYVPDEQIFTDLLEAAIDLLPEIAEAKIIEKRGDIICYGAAPAYMKPVLGRLPEWDNAYILGQFGVLGITQSAGAGEVMADLIAGNVRAPSPVYSMIENISPK